jgi:GntR family transcriptional regulator, transcriptional repressor for pyruvate dehydrogenase complex
VATHSVFSSIRTQSLASRIVHQVIEALFAGQLEPGQFLGTEAQLAETFKTSRMPIREALGRLEALGVVTIKTGAGGGATIAEGKPDQFATALAVQFMLVQVSPEEIFDARIGIECRAAELAAERITDEEIEELRRLLARVMAPNLSRRASVERILAFHSAIVEASGARTLITLMHALENALLNLFIAVEPDATSKAIRYDSLNGILDRIAARDGEGAFMAMREHLTNRRQSMVYRLKQVSGRKIGSNRSPFASRIPADEDSSD